MLYVTHHGKRVDQDNSCKFKVNQSHRYDNVHSCLELSIKMSTNNPSRKSSVLESSVQPSLGKQACPSLVWLIIRCKTLQIRTKNMG